MAALDLALISCKVFTFDHFAKKKTLIPITTQFWREKKGLAAARPPCMENSKKRTRGTKLPRSTNVIATGEDEGFILRVHDQGTDETCVAHAFTTMHELVARRALQTDDLLMGAAWMKDIGALMTDVATRLETMGQRLLRPGSPAAGGLAKSKRVPRRCQEALRLRCEQLPANTHKCKERLAQGSPLVLTTTAFSLKVSALSTLNREHDRHRMDGLHAVCLYGYVDDDSVEGGGVFLCVNSHGAAWGVDGRGTLTYAFLSEFAHQVWAPALDQERRKSFRLV